MEILIEYYNLDCLFSYIFNDLYYMINCKTKEPLTIIHIMCVELYWELLNV